MGHTGAPDHRRLSQQDARGGGSGGPRSLTGLNASSIRSVCTIGTSLLSGSFGRGIFRSTNGGGAWVESNSGFPSAYIYALGSFGGKVFGGAALTIGMSADSGKTWMTSMTAGAGTSFISFGQRGNELYAGTNNGAVYRSLDTGATWTLRNTGLPTANVFALVSMDSLLFAATGQGVYMTSDAGSSWSLRSTGMTTTDARALCVAGSKLLCGTAYGGVFMSTDKGATWSPRNTSLMPNVVYALSLIGSTVFAGTLPSGVWVSRSDTLKWSSTGTGFTLGPTVYTLASDAHYLYAGIEGQGVWRRALSEVLLDVNDGERTTPLQYTLEQNFPNPFNPSTTIRFSLPVRSSVRIIAYSLLGQEVATIFNGTLDAGIHSVPFDGSRLSSGVYFCRMQSGAFQSARSMLLVR